MEDRKTDIYKKQKLTKDEKMIETNKKNQQRGKQLLLAFLIVGKQ